jgi:hypothetical protein
MSQKWEYLVIDSFDAASGVFMKLAPSRENIQAYLNHLGQDGWEIVNIDFFENTNGRTFMGLARREIAVAERA